MTSVSVRGLVDPSSLGVTPGGSARRSWRSSARIPRGKSVRRGVRARTVAALEREVRGPRSRWTSMVAAGNCAVVEVGCREVRGAVRQARGFDQERRLPFSDRGETARRRRGGRRRQDRRGGSSSVSSSRCSGEGCAGLSFSTSFFGELGGALRGGPGNRSTGESSSVSGVPAL